MTILPFAEIIISFIFTCSDCSATFGGENWRKIAQISE
jgi:hypothetical protein